MSNHIYDIPSPAVIIDLDVAERNIYRVTNAAKKEGINLRPHIKTHKSVYLTKKLLEAGAKGITVAKISEAEVMIENGIDNILIAYPVLGKEKWERLRKLNRIAQIMTTVDSMEIANGLNEIGTKDYPINVLIEVDSGTHRCGVQPGNDFIKFALKVKEMEGIKIRGVFTYNGLIYGSKSLDEIKSHAEAEANLLKKCVEQLKDIGIEEPISSGGNTPITIALDKMKGVTEIRPGNFIFNDVTGLDLGVAEEKDCAIRILARVVSIPLPGHAAIDAGSKTLTSDTAARSPGFGYIVGMPDVKIVKLNEEHGLLKYDPDKRKLSIGQVIEIIPNHACVIPNLCDFIYGVRNGKIEKEIKIDARGKNY
ncbi:MAG TPA: amino acid processing protein [Clostridiaceae bacterium]|nr:amino acid processing protein [Clostridiaceae bacterium]